jgi:hypothetical protein
MGVSQFEPPFFKRYRIVEDITPENVQNVPQVPSEPLGDNLPEYITKAEFEPFKTLLQKIEKELYADEPTE